MALEGKRVAVSGGAGVIGTALVHRLRRQGASVWVGDLKARPNSFDPEVVYRQGDLNYIRASELAAFRPEVFIHLAATFERSLETPEFWTENYHHNVRLSHHLCSVLQEISVRRLLFASSYLVYDPRLYLHKNPQQLPRSLAESDAVHPRNLCGAAKFYHEQELHFLAHANPSCRILTARIFRGYGRGSRDVISRWVRELLNDRPLEVFRSEGIFDFVYADDSAEALIRLALADSGEIVNVGTGSARTVGDVLTILRRHFPRMQIRQVDSSIAYEASQADIALLRKFTSWQPEFTLETAIPEIIEYERRQFESDRELSLAADKHSRASRNSSAGGVLVTSVSRKVPMLEAVRVAAKKIGAPFHIIGADTNANCIASHFVDRFWCTPPLSQLSGATLIDYCHRNDVGFIIPSRDGELDFFASVCGSLAEKGVAVMISSADAVRTCHDKLKFAETLRAHGIPAIQTFLRVDDVPSERIVVKERFGAGAHALQINVDRESARRFGASLSSPIYQPFIEGSEFSVDLYVDRSGKCKGTIARRREVVVGGESQVTTTQRHPAAESLCAVSAELLGIRGHAVFQIIEGPDETVRVIECNARFGGASTLSVAAGLDSFYWFLLEARNQSISQYPFARSPMERRQIRYARDLVIDA